MTTSEEKARETIGKGIAVSSLKILIVFEYLLKNFNCHFITKMRMFIIKKNNLEVAFSFFWV